VYIEDALVVPAIASGRTLYALALFGTHRSTAVIKHDFIPTFYTNKRVGNIQSI